MTSNVILGNGLSALIWGAYHPGSIIIGPGEPGGMVESLKGPFFLHKHPATHQMLEMLDLSTRTKEVRVGYCWIGVGDRYIGKHPPEGFRDKYYRYSRSLSYNESPIVPSSVMNSEQSRFEAYPITMGEMIERLVKKIEEEKGIFWDRKITRIDIEDDRALIRAGGLTVISTERVVSTIPAPIFRSLINPCPNRVSEAYDFYPSLTKVYRKLSPEADTEGYDIIYTCPTPEEKETFDSGPLTRINKNTKKEVWAEYTFPGDTVEGEIFAKNMIQRYGEPNISVQIRSAVRINKTEKYPGIILLGRGARWDHSIKIQNVVEGARNHAGE